MNTDRKYPPGVIPCFAAIISLLLAVIGGGLFFHACSRPSPIPLQVSASSAASSSTVASQSIKITIKHPSAAAKPYDVATPQAKQNGPLTQPHNGLLGKLAAVIHPTQQASGLPEPHSGPSSDSSVLQPQEDEIVVELSQNMASQGSATASASVVNQVTDSSPIGVIAGTMPGGVALDYRFAHLGPIGIDVAANHRSVSAGISAGGKIFGLAGGYQGFDGKRGILAGAGVRF